MPIYKDGDIKKEGLQKYRVRINYFDNLGKKRQITRTEYGLDRAKFLEAKLSAEYRDNSKIIIKKMKLNKLFEEYISFKKYEVRETSLSKTMRILKRYILPRLGDIEIDKINVNVLRDWKLYIHEKNISNTTKNNIYTELRTLLNYAVKMQYIGHHNLISIGNFKDPMYSKKDIDFYIPEEFKKFIEAARNQAIQKETIERNRYEWNFYVFFNIAYYTGLRKGEIHALKWSNIKGEYLQIKNSITQKLKDKEDIETPPKNLTSVRTIQIPKPLIEILEEDKKRKMELKNFNKEDKILGDERCLRDTTIENRNKLYADIAGIKKIRIHDFRHSHASLLANMGINIQEIARRLGHAKVEITWNIYSHLYPKEEEKAMEILNNI